MRNPNTIIINDDGTISIILTKGQKTVIDSDCYKKIMGYKWCALWSKKTKSYRPVTTISRKQIFMYRIIMDVEDGAIIVDHINRDTLDNRKSNLRLTTNMQNSRNRIMSKRNTTGYKGVYPLGKKYAAQIRVNYKKYHLGVYNSVENAAIAYNIAALHHYGEYALLNKVSG